MKDLNPEQQEAVEYNDGPLMIIAGPGTGKTKTLIQKISYLVKVLNIPSNQILAVTFTTKAVKELKDRLTQELELPKDTKNFPLLTTFHALSYDILRNFQNISIISDEDRRTLINNISNNFHDFNNFSTKELELIISKFKSYPDKDTNYFQFVDLYNQHLKDKNLYDYDDLIINALSFILNEKYTKKYKYILVDEFQDTNSTQYKLVKSLLQPENNIFVIGDPLQSIYSFRGASKNVFDLFNQDFPKSKQIDLNRNYRSSKSIIKIGHQLFPTTTIQISEQNEDGTVQFVTTLNEYSEADFIINKISQTMGGMSLVEASNNSNIQTGNDLKAKFSDFAVIYRVHNLNRTLEQKFTDNGIPFQVVGGDSIYEKKEVEFFINSFKYFYYQQLQESDSDKELLHKTIVQLAISELFGNDRDTIEKITLIVKNINFQNLKEYVEQHHTSSQKLNNLLKFLEFLNNSMSNDIVDFVESVIKFLKLENFYDEKPKKIINIYQFLSTLYKYKSIPLLNSIKTFIDDIENLKQNDYYDEMADKVTLLTMHASKGLEFKYVFIIGFEEGFIPYTLKAKSEEELDEERRLLYVAITRSKVGLFLMKTIERNRQKTSPSPFEKELDIDLLEKTTDPMIEKINKKRRIDKEKKSQMGMF